jgi:hypothetical protein
MKKHHAIMRTESIALSLKIGDIITITINDDGSFYSINFHNNILSEDYILDRHTGWKMDDFHLYPPGNKLMELLFG